jgi:DNA transposition AAA+ family ATPase
MVMADTAAAIRLVRPEDQAPVDFRDAVRARLEQDAMSHARAAREIGISAPAFTQWLNGNYPSEHRALTAKIDRWLRVRVERQLEIDAAPEVPGFRMTPTAKRIVATLKYAQTFGDMVEVYGLPGTSKTFTARHYRDENPNVWIATIVPDCAATQPALDEIAETVGAGVGLGLGTRKLARNICAKIEKTRGLLIVDEAQHLTITALEEIRSLHDRTGIGLALMGSIVLHSRLTAGSRAEHMAQLFSRIGVRLSIRQPSAGDIGAILDAWKVRGAEERAYLGEIGVKAGALRVMTKAIRLAFATADDGHPTLEDFQAAWRQIGAYE